jgi:hypothetical protein
VRCRTEPQEGGSTTSEYLHIGGHFDLDDVDHHHHDIGDDADQRG